MMNKKKVLITGSNGLVGSKLLDCFQSAEQFEVIATSRSVDKNRDKSKYAFELLDISHSPAVNYIMDLYQPEIIINTAAEANVNYCESHRAECREANVEGVRNLLAAAGKHRAHFVQISTDFVFQGNRELYREEDGRLPVNYYGQTKLEAEELVETYPFHWNIIRTVLVFGKEMHYARPNFFTWIYDALKAGKNLKIVNDQYRTPTWSEDLAKGIISLLKQNSIGIYHIAGNEKLSIFEFAHLIARAAGFNSSLLEPVSSSSLNEPARRPVKTWLDTGKIYRETGFTPKPLKEILALLMSF